MNNLLTLHLEDHGQDFLELDVEDIGGGLGIIRACRPFQEEVWKGLAVRMDTVQVGERIEVGKPGLEARPRLLHYPIASITQHAPTAG